MAPMQFDLTDLRLFVLTAEEGALSRAAAARHLSLAAASARIKALEQQAGMPLLRSRDARELQRMIRDFLTVLEAESGVSDAITQQKAG